MEVRVAAALQKGSSGLAAKCSGCVAALFEDLSSWSLLQSRKQQCVLVGWPTGGHWWTLEVVHSLLAGVGVGRGLVVWDGWPCLTSVNHGA